MKVIEFSEQEQADFKATHELANPKRWAVMDGALIYEWYDTEEEAKIGLRQAEIAVKVADEFDAWLIEQAEKYGVSEAEIKSIIV